MKLAKEMPRKLRYKEGGRAGRNAEAKSTGNSRKKWSKKKVKRDVED